MSLVTIQACDPSIGLTQRAKYFVVTTGTMDLVTRRIYLRHVYRGRLEVPEQVRTLQQLYDDWGPVGLYIEETFWQTSLIQLLRAARPDMNVQPIDRRRQGNPDVGVRAMPLAARYEQRQIHHPAEQSEWLDAFEDELLQFTGVRGRDEYTDQVSAWADTVWQLTRIATYQTQVDFVPRYGTFTYDMPGGLTAGDDDIYHAVLACLAQGRPVACESAQYRNTRHALHKAARLFIEEHDSARAQIALLEVKRLDDLFAGRVA